ncbi:MAG: PorV/PorQ family protein [Ignavibacteria bacterium]
MNSNKIILTFLILFISCSRSYSQTYNYEFDEFFFGRQPSARSEALGRSFVSIVGDANSYYYNPAGLAGLHGLNLSGTYADPYYLATDASYNFLSASYRIGNYGVVGISRDYLKLADVQVTNEFGVPTGKEYTLSLRNLRLSIASEVIKNLYAGVNLNFFRSYDFTSFNIAGDGQPENIFYADLGVIKSLNFDGKNLKHTVNFGSSIININSGGGNGDYLQLPVIFRIGAAYNLIIDNKEIIPNLKNYNFLLTSEYQKLFNSDHYDGIKTGLEFTLLELLSLRTGYYFQDIRKDNCENCKKELNEFTFGFGVNVPIQKLSKSNIPLNIMFDYTALEQPSHVTDIKNWSDFHVYNLRLNWLFK